MTTRWTYKVVKFETVRSWLGGKLDENAMNRDLDRLGAEGWELVSCFGTHQGHGTTRHVLAVLKRPA